MNNKNFHFIFIFFLLNCCHSLNAAEAEYREQIIDVGYAQFLTYIWDGEETDSNSDNKPETIFALPGSGADVSRYQLIGPLLAEAGYRLVGINQRGIMGSTGALSDLTLHDLAADVIAIADVLGVEKFHMAGWAFGNRTSRMLATIYPERLESLTLIAAGGLVPALTEPGELGRLLGEPTLSLDEKVYLARRTMFSPASSDSAVLNYVQELTYWPDAQAAQRQANQNTELDEWADGGTGPILMVMGVDDLTAPIENGYIMQERLGERLQLVTVTGAGHAMGLEKPDIVANAMIQFLSQHPISP